jgi:hypothetical protein
MRKKVLLVGGSLNQTRMAHAVGQHLERDYDCYYTPFYCDGIYEYARRKGWLEFTILGDRIRLRTQNYLVTHGLPMDYGGQLNNYDLVVTTSDLIVPQNLYRKPVVLIQEGMTDPEDWRFWMVLWFKLPRWIAGTSTNGLSNAYRYFCVASPGYRDLFVRKGCRPEKVIVTGIPNFDNAQSYCQNDFPHRDYVLVATSNARETYKPDNRQKFLRWTLEKAAGRPLIFKLHPNENVPRATQEIKSVAPQALVYADGNTDHMIANCSALITQYSSCVYVGLALGKECYSYFNIEMLRRLTPIQNGGRSGANIAQICRNLLEQPATQREKLKPVKGWLSAE